MAEVTLDYLLGEIVVDTPDERADYMRFNMLTEETCDWPKGFWAVSEEENAYIAFFRFEADAWSFRLWLINVRQNAPAMLARYKSDVTQAPDEEYDSEEEDGPPTNG